MGHLNSHQKAINRSSKQKIIKEIALKDTLDTIYIINIYRAFHPRNPSYIFSSSVHGTFSRTDHMLGQKTSLKKYKKTEIIQSILPDHNALKLEVNSKKKKKKKQLQENESKCY